MVERLPAWIFLFLGLLLVASAQLPVVRVLLGIDQEFGLRFVTVVMLMIGGLMSGLTAMILLVRRQAKVNPQQATEGLLAKTYVKRKELLLHLSGLLMFTGIPLLNFLVAYWLWLGGRHHSQVINQTGIDVLNFQITIYLYLLLSLFMIFAGIGVLTTPLILIFHFIVTLLASLFTIKGKTFSYPANIPIIQGRRAADADY